jgi:hypothetical protein
MDDRSINKHSFEISLLHWFCGLFFVLTITGLVTWFIDAVPPLIEQALSIMHLFAGLGVSLVFFYYSIHHFRRTISFRRVLSILLGSLVFIVFLYVLISGVTLFYHGVLRKNTWIYESHVWVSFLVVLFLITHILVHYVTFPKRRLLSIPSRFVTLSSKVLRPVLIGLLLSGAGVLGLITIDYSFSSESISAESSLHKDYLYSYGDGPFLPSLTKTSTGTFVKKRDISGSKECITCHQATGEQWLASAHRLAAKDPSYVRNVNLLEKSRGIAATRYCEGCHAPIALLTGQLTPGGKHGGVSDTAANDEGISCMSCHGINQLTSSEGVASYNFKARTAYLFEHANSWPLKNLNHLVINLKPSLHKKELQPDLLTTSEYCGSCHTQFMDKSMNEWGWVKMQDEVLAWANSKFNMPKDSRFTHPKNKQCQDCHMPLIDGHDQAADINGKVKSHFFVGANVMLAKHFNNEKLYKRTKKFLQQDKVDITIVPPENPLTKQSRLFVATDIRSKQKYPVAMYRGTSNKITVLVSNQGVGHNFPGGSIDLNEAWIDLKVFDGSQNLITSSGDLLPNGAIEPTATVYKEVAIDRFGKEVWRHDLFNMVGRSYVNVIPSGTTDIVEYEVKIPDWATSPLTISATLKYRKLNQKYLDWVNLKQKIKENPIVDISRDSIQVPLLKVPSSVQ